MNTEVVMKRRLFDGKISQKGKNGYFSATDSVNIGNIWRLQNRLPLFSLRSWLQTKSTEQFIDCLLYTSPSPRDLSTSRMPSSA